VKISGKFMKIEENHIEKNSFFRKMPVLSILENMA
jgi:hypothetical protein